MNSLRQNVPQKHIEQKRLDALNGFVFNVDTPADLVQVYGSYHLRGEPLNTLETIQDAFFTASQKELVRLAREYLDPGRIQIFVVGDKFIKAKNERGDELTLEETLMELAEALDLPYRELELR
jgi:predicted Zn-dependent peptidase